MKSSELRFQSKSLQLSGERNQKVGRNELRSTIRRDMFKASFKQNYPMCTAGDSSSRSSDEVCAVGFGLQWQIGKGGCHRHPMTVNCHAKNAADTGTSL